MTKMNKKQKVKANTKTRRNGRLGNGVEKRVIDHVNMVSDPCNSLLAPTAYRGMDGYLTRFANNLTIPTVAGKTGFIFIYYPAYNTIYNVAANPNDTFNLTMGLSAGPGQAFLLSNASSQRAVGACCTLGYTGTELNRSGTLWVGNLPYAALQGPVVTAASLIPLCQRTMRTPDAPLDIKWEPAAVDEQYWETGTGAPPNLGDRNVIVIIGQGFSSDTTVNFTVRSTLVAEWRPDFGLGLQTTNPNTPDVPGGLEKVRSILAGLGDWWVSSSHTMGRVATVAGTLAQSYNNFRRGYRATPRLLTM